MTGCTFSNDYKEDYNILENNSIRFIKSDASISFLINKDNTFYLLVLNGTTVTDTDYLIKIDNTKYNINYTEEYLLKDTLVLQDIIFKINDKIEIILNNKTFCIYLDRLNKDNFLHSCEYAILLVLKFCHIIPWLSSIDEEGILLHCSLYSSGKIFFLISFLISWLR